MNIEHPVITNMERTGHPDGKEPRYPRCPICNEECETIYMQDCEVVGCNECVGTKDAWEVEECF